MQRLPKMRDSLLTLSRRQNLARGIPNQSLHARPWRRGSSFLCSVRGLPMRRSLPRRRLIHKQGNRSGSRRPRKVHSMWTMHQRLSRPNPPHPPHRQICSDLRPLRRRATMRRGLQTRRMERPKSSDEKRPKLQGVRTHSRGDNPRPRCKPLWRSRKRGDLGCAATPENFLKSTCQQRR